MCTPNYMTTEDIRLVADWQDEFIIPAGTFVKPVDLVYVPKHVVDSKYNMHYNKDEDQFCYSSYGMHIIPNKFIRKV